MLYFLVKAHHHWKLTFRLMSKASSPAARLRLMTKSLTVSRECEVLLLLKLSTKFR